MTTPNTTPSAEQKLAALVDLIADTKKAKVRNPNSDFPVYEYIEPDLCRVLWWLSRNGELNGYPFLDIDRSSPGEFCYPNDEMGDGYSGVAWDFSKSLLRDQSEEVISFLYDLLITK